MSNILCQIDEQMMDDFPVSSTHKNFNDDFPVSSTHYEDLNDGQVS
jgi:hypothetical protein